jgi:hypothetical protein
MLKRPAAVVLGAKALLDCLAVSGSPCRGRAAGRAYKVATATPAELARSRLRHRAPGIPLSLYARSDSVGGPSLRRCFCLEQQRGYVVRRLAALSMIVPSERLPKVV